ncbi:hypothetical protein T310_4983 [Rasamsonia emersonii CBS 393.64]|uniref:Uncharacterized protein n=1 Tax=Rasamsonia emersonii (strain ATCC 16479 / CBS 393.64 / IMI 116815) TaxID=1408163 RepID=A0A0F4YRW5_RASE3|nr:hypothetical protein T310_4983 [Rasamsonia emersonii CBS 393.64]KKA20984.1 hypothetical protein T310_4983 [Rasamsonia emersonii CBS 393.64]
MPQQNVPASHGSLRGQGPSLRRGPNKISKAIPSPREEQDGRGPQALRMSDQVSTPSLGQTRASQSSTVSGSRRQPYGATSFHNPQYSISSAVSHDSTLQWRRGSALKNVMRKLFTRKRQSQLDEDEGEREQLTNIRTEKENDGTGPSRGLFAAVHNSPGANGTPSITTNKRSTGISHLSSSSSDHQVQLGQSMTLPVPRQGPRRRATLPSLVLSDEDARETAMSVVAASSPRPGSAVSREPPRSLEQRSRASTQVHRRSQSAGALRDLMRRHRMSPIQWRRRSDEMKFWPTSTLDLDHDHVPPHERPQTSATETTAATMEEDQIQPLEGRDTAPQTEPEGAPFNLGNLIQDPDVTLEQRVTTLEVKLMDLEFAIAKIQGTQGIGFAGNRGRPDATKRDGVRRAPSLPVACSTSFAGDGRPISTGTLRPNTAYPRNQPSWQTPSSSTTNLNNISIDQYSALVTLVRREQTARRALEDQVAQLQEEMRHLRQAGHLPVSPPGTYYPIPSPDSDDARGSRRLHTTPSRKEERPVVESEAATEGNHYESRHWDSSHYRSNIETNQRNVVPGMI